MAAADEQPPQSTNSTIMTLEQFGIMGVSGVAWAFMTELPRALVGIPVDGLHFLLQCSPDLSKELPFDFSSIGSLLSSIRGSVGLSQLWRGATAGCLHDLLLRILMPRFSILCDQALCSVFGPHQKARESWAGLWARKVAVATVAASLAQLIAHPFTMAHTYMVLDAGAVQQYPTMWSFFSQMVHLHGWSFLWRGSSLVWQRCFAFAIVRFSMDPFFNQRPSSVLTAFGGALTASTLPDIFTEPMDAVRRRVMIGGFDKSGWSYGGWLARNRCPIHFWNGMPITFGVDLLFSSAAALAHWHSQTTGEMQQVD
eukprot:m.19865 g.19865  ORF g.19865 m.19865 type:complete len:312 (+) comp10967_c0_seq1:23-958(+)